MHELREEIATQMMDGKARRRLTKVADKVEALAKAAQAVADAARDNPTPGQLATLRGALAACGVAVRSQAEHAADWPPEPVPAHHACPQRGCPQTDGLPCSFPCCPMRRPKRSNADGVS